MNKTLLFVVLGVAGFVLIIHLANKSHATNNSLLAGGTLYVPNTQQSTAGLLSGIFSGISAALPPSLAQVNGGLTATNPSLYNGNPGNAGSNVPDSNTGAGPSVDPLTGYSVDYTDSAYTDPYDEDNSLED
jgi:hypothetical protein